MADSTDPSGPYQNDATSDDGDFENRMDQFNLAEPSTTGSLIQSSNPMHGWPRLYRPQQSETASGVSFSSQGFLHSPQLNGSSGYDQALPINSSYDAAQGSSDLAPQSPHRTFGSYVSQHSLGPALQTPTLAALGQITYQTPAAGAHQISQLDPYSMGEVTDWVLGAGTHATAIPNQHLQHTSGLIHRSEPDLNPRRPGQFGDLLAPPANTQAIAPRPTSILTSSSNSPSGFDSFPGAPVSSSAQTPITYKFEMVTAASIQHRTRKRRSYSTQGKADMLRTRAEGACSDCRRKKVKVRIPVTLQFRRVDADESASVVPNIGPRGRGASSQLGRGAQFHLERGALCHTHPPSSAPPSRSLYGKTLEAFQISIRLHQTRRSRTWSTSRRLKDPNSILQTGNSALHTSFKRC